MSDEYEEYHGAHRDKIPWHPTIDYNKCVSCGTCVEYCKLGVYDVVEEQGKKKTGSCLKIRNSEGSETCPLSTMKDLYMIIKESDKIVTF